jgi:hypothetical protein
MTKIFNRKFAAVLLSVAMAAVLFAGFGTPAWAAGDENVTVTIYVQEAYRDDPDNTLYFTQVYLGNEDPGEETDPVVITVPSGSTLKEAIQAAGANNTAIAASEWNDNYGVPDSVWLSSLTFESDYYGEMTYANDGEYDDPYNPTEWIGASWLYFNGTPDDMPADVEDYPGWIYDGIQHELGNVEVTADTTITLSYEYILTVPVE